MNPLKKAVVRVVVKRGAAEALKQIDTPGERRGIVEKVQIRGLPAWASWATAVVVSLLLEAVSTVGFDLLIAGDSKAWAMLLARTVASKALLMMDESKDAQVQDEAEPEPKTEPVK